jgi:O-acetyl-ADP-ribose deacetylase (regulator of RNase III)
MGRVTIREGDPALDAADALVLAADEAAEAEDAELASRRVIRAETAGRDGRTSEATFREGVRRSFEAARSLGCRSVALPALGARGGIPLQRRAEILIEEARRHLAGETSLEEIRFVVRGEPAYRLFEAVQDAIRIAEQARRWT